GRAGVPCAAQVSSWKIPSYARPPMRLPTSCICLFALCAITGVANGEETQTTHPTADEVLGWANETSAQIEKDFWLDDLGTYAERVGPWGAWRGSRPAYAWSLGVQLSSLVAAAKNDDPQYA